jgi:peptidyl-prolyl cis-trans isomerase C
MREIEASHILVSSEELANDLRTKIVEGAIFEDLAKEHSLCPSKRDGGNLGLFAPGTMVREFNDTAFSLKVGELSEPVKTRFGWHVIKRIA